jgi:Tfp pilus assembly protein PilF
VHRLVQIARERFEAGNLKAADKILQAALEIEPRNNEAWYYSDLVQKAIRANENRKGIRLWYPTVPPRPSRQ